MVEVVHVAPNNTPCWAVLARESGMNPEFRPVVAWACCRVTYEGGEEGRVVAGIALGLHPEPIDFDPAFVGYATEKTVTREWLDRAKDKAAEVAAKKAAKAASPIIDPTAQKIVNPFDRN